MTVRRGVFAAASLAAAVAVVSASPVWAEPLDGSYTMAKFEPLPGSEQVILTPCGPDCTNWRYSAPGNLPEGVNFHLHGNQWVMDTNSKFYFDKDSLKGSLGSPDLTDLPTVPFALTKNG